jgi:hypothetical protein
MRGTASADGPIAKRKGSGLPIRQPRFESGKGLYSAKARAGRDGGDSPGLVRFSAVTAGGVRRIGSPILAVGSVAPFTFIAALAAGFRRKGGRLALFALGDQALQEVVPLRGRCPDLPADKRRREAMRRKQAGQPLRVTPSGTNCTASECGRGATSSTTCASRGTGVLPHNSHRAVTPSRGRSPATATPSL